MLSLVVMFPAEPGIQSPLQIHAEFIEQGYCEGKWAVNDGFQPKICPVVSGAMPMKNRENNLRHADHARKAMQKGVSTKNGCD